MGKKKRGSRATKATAADSTIAALDSRKPFDYIDVDRACLKFAELSDEFEGAACYICLEEDGGRERPLLRDCSCRGSSGWAHFECLVKYDEKKSEELFQKGRYSPDELRDIWGICCNCKQEFKNDLCVAMAAAFVNFIQGQPAYTRKEWDLLESSKFKQSTHFQSHPDEGQAVSRKLLSLLEIANARSNAGPKIPKQRLLELEADTCRAYGYFCCMDEDYEEAIEHSERAVAIYKKLSAEFDNGNYTAMIADSQGKIEEVKRLTSGGGTKLCSESELEKQRILYEAAVKQDGEVSTISSGLDYSERLAKSGYRIKAQRLASKLLPISLRVHGPNHSITERASLAMVLNRYRGMEFKGEQYAFLKYKKAKDKYVVRGPLNLANLSHISDEAVGKRSMVHITSCQLDRGTPIIIHGLAPSQDHFNGEIGEVMETILSFKGTAKVFSYNIRLEDGSEVVIMSNNLQILFDVPDEE